MSLGSEKFVLSLMFQQPKEFIPRAIGKRLKPKDFQHPAHAAIYKVLLEEFEAGKEFSLVAFVQSLLDRGMLFSPLTPSLITDIYTFADTPCHFDHHLMLMRGME